MLNKDFFINVFLILGLILLQVFIFNNFNIASIYNPLFFLTFMIFFTHHNSNIVLISAFVLGLGLDFFMNTLGVNALACILTLKLRNIFFKYIINKSGSSEVDLSQTNSIQVIILILIISLFYNIFVFALESFSLNNLIYTLQKGFLNGLITAFTITLFYLLFKRRLRT